MVSDIVLLKELPDPIRDSVEAYTGCIAGATLKDDETIFPIDVLENDPIGKKVIEKLNLSIEEVKEVGKSIVSIKVQAKK